MYHSINLSSFEDIGSERAINSWRDWHLVPIDKPRIVPPSVRTEYKEIPGLSGSLDYTEALTGLPTYSDRSGNLDFYVVDYDYKYSDIYSEILNKIHGQRLYLTLEDDPDYFYTGRFAVSAWSPSNSPRPKLTINYVVEPFKKKVKETVIIRSVKASEEALITLPNETMPVIPTVEVVMEGSGSGVDAPTVGIVNWDNGVWRRSAVRQNVTVNNKTKLYQCPILPNDNVFQLNPYHYPKDHTYIFTYREGRL